MGRGSSIVQRKEKRRCLRPPRGSSDYLLYLYSLGTTCLPTMHGRSARDGSRKIVLDDWRSPLGPRRWARMGMVLRPGGGRRRASGLGEKRRVPRGLCRPPCTAVHASQSPFRTTRVCRGRGHSGVAKIRWGRWKLTLSWLPLCACPGTRPAPGVAEVPRVPTYALLVTVVTL
jgi:hypothetical protein